MYTNRRKNGKIKYKYFIFMCAGGKGAEWVGEKYSVFFLFALVYLPIFEWDI